MNYQITIDGKVTDLEVGTDGVGMFNRGDMSYLGFAAHDVRPPEGYTLTFDEPGSEPTFVLTIDVLARRDRRVNHSRDHRTFAKGCEFCAAWPA